MDDAEEFRDLDEADGPCLRHDLVRLPARRAALVRRAPLPRLTLRLLCFSAQGEGHQETALQVHGRTLGHRGVLFLDELTDFPARRVLLAATALPR